MTKQPHPRSEAPKPPAGAPKPDPSLRQCLSTRERLPKAALLRFVIGPDGQVLPDLNEKLPGRGLWVKAERAVLETAIKKRQFIKAAKGHVDVAKNLPDLIEDMLARRCLSLLGQAHGAGLVVLGGSNVGTLLRDGAALALIEAEDGQPDGRRKMLGALKAGQMNWLAPAGEAEPLIAGCFTSAQLSLALGRENVIHAALKDGGLSGRVLTELRRLGGFRPLRPASWAAPGGASASRGNASVSDA